MAKKEKQQEGQRETPIIGRKTEEHRVKLTSVEILERSQRLAATHRELEQHAQYESSVKASLKATATRIEAEQARLVLAVENGAELRPIEVLTTADFRAGRAIERRRDTWEIVRERPLTEDEIQAEFSFGAGDAA